MRGCIRTSIGRSSGGSRRGGGPALATLPDGAASSYSPNSAEAQPGQKTTIPARRIVRKVDAAGTPALPRIKTVARRKAALS
jgi:hypothetical protein